MFKISEFSSFTRVSVKMLRHYDELGLLKPVSIDPQNNYRYYSSNQLPRLNRIIALKDLGFSLEQIGRMLDEKLTPDEIRGMFKLRRMEIEQHLELEQARLRQVENRLRYLEQNAQHLDYDIVVREVEPVLAACMRHQGPGAAEQVYPMFEELEGYVASQRARAFLSPLTIYHDEEYQEDYADIEVAVPILRPVPTTQRISVREIPGEPAMACVVFSGGYERTEEVLNALMIWIEANAYRSRGNYREVYLRFGADAPEEMNLPQAFLTDQRELLVTEIQVPVEKLEQVPAGTASAARASGLLQVGQVRLPVQDLSRAVEFYRDKLGLKYLYQDGQAAFFDCAGLRLALEVAAGGENAAAGALLSYTVDDIQAEYERLSALEVRFEGRPERGHPADGSQRRSCTFYDSEGNKLELLDKQRGDEE
jgi:DNA-binding transcriptional MerR regulator/catechol 2,3-dioxygenase-like lactoylglutathione lyase family enzyme